MKKGKSVFTDDVRYCFLCMAPYPEEHHIFGASNRKISDRYGFVIPLCPNCHRGNNGVHFNRKLDVQLKVMAQNYFEEHIGTEEEFIKTFGKSWKGEL